MKLENIKKAYVMNSGGNCLIDILELNNGMILALSDEYIGLYKSLESIFEEKEIKGFSLDLQNTTI